MMLESNTFTVSLACAHFFQSEHNKVKSRFFMVYSLGFRVFDNSMLGLVADFGNST